MKNPPDPLRNQLQELTTDITQRVNALREFATVPGNVWLAKGELQQLTVQLGDLENLLEAIKEADTEDGY